MILTDKQILEAVTNGDIIIDPWRPENLGTNSYDVHLGRYMALYTDRELDARNITRSAL